MKGAYLVVLVVVVAMVMCMPTVFARSDYSCNDWLSCAWTKVLMYAEQLNPETISTTCASGYHVESQFFTQCSNTPYYLSGYQVCEWTVTSDSSCPYKNPSCLKCVADSSTPSTCTPSCNDWSKRCPNDMDIRQCVTGCGSGYYFEYRECQSTTPTTPTTDTSGGGGSSGAGGDNAPLIDTCQFGTYKCEGNIGYVCTGLGWDEVRNCDVLGGQCTIGDNGASLVCQDEMGNPNPKQYACSSDKECQDKNYGVICVGGQCDAEWCEATGMEISKEESEMKYWCCSGWVYHSKTEYLLGNYQEKWFCAEAYGSTPPEAKAWENSLPDNAPFGEWVMQSIENSIMKHWMLYLIGGIILVVIIAILSKSNAQVSVLRV